MKTQAVIYIRVSTNKQDNSLEMQRDKCVLFCKEKDYEVVDIIIDEDISGGSKIFKRPGGSVLKERIDNKEINHVVSWKLDRISRKVIDGLTFIDTLNKEGIGMSILDLNGESIDTNTATGKFFISLMLSLNEMERGIISERTSTILQNKKKNLEVYSRKAPFGFKKRGKKLIPVEKDLDKVRKVIMLHQTRSKRKLSIDLVLGYNIVSRIIRDKDFYKDHI